jgi:hypothetical protein
MFLPLDGEMLYNRTLDSDTSYQDASPWISNDICIEHGVDMFAKVNVWVLLLSAQAYA